MNKEKDVQGWNGREIEKTGEMMKRRRVFIWRRLGEEMKSQWRSERITRSIERMKWNFY